MSVFRITVLNGWSQMKFNDPVGTGLKLNVHKPFRRHPGRLLNVLCMFNLRPVPTGGRHVKMLEDYYEKWKIKSKIFFYFTVLL